LSGHELYTLMERMERRLLRHGAGTLGGRVRGMLLMFQGTAEAGEGMIAPVSGRCSLL